MPAQHLIAPREKPDGTVSWEEQEPDLADRIRQGDANIGWLGDERLSLHLNLEHELEGDDGITRKVPRWEVWRRHEDGTTTLVCHKLGVRPNPEQLLRGLAACDSRTRDVAVEMIAARAAKEARAAAEFAEHVEDKADKFHWALSKDLGEPVASGRVIRMGGR